MKETTARFIALLLILVFIGGVSFLVYVLVVEVPKWEREYQADRKARYEECKAKTQDIEWCVKEIVGKYAIPQIEP